MKAKNIVKYIGVTLLCAGLNGCADFIDNAPDDQLDLEMVFNDKTRTEDWLANVYSGVPDSYWKFAKDIGWDTVGDDITPSQRWLQWWGGSLLNFRVGNFYTSSGWNSNFWNQLPQRIRSAYILINNAHANPLQKVTEEDIELMKNECRFLVAYYYWMMTEAYGAVPYYSDVLDVNTPLSEMMVGQMAFDDMVNMLDQQLLELSEKLPAKWEEAFFGRATSIACLAVRARMLLFAASPLVNGNEWYKGMTLYDGKERFNSTYDANKWKKAADACKLLIEKAEAAGHGLYYEYTSDGKIDPFMSTYNLFLKKTSEGNNEILFARPDCNYGEWEKHSTPRGCGGNGGMGVTQEMVDAFFMKNGLSPILGYNADGSPIINDASGYTESGFSTEPEIRNTKWDPCRKSPDVKAGQITLSNTYNMYSNREPRFYVSVLFNGTWFHQEGRTTRMMSNEWDGGPTHDAPQNGYLNRKKTSLESIPRDGKRPYRPAILFRLGEAYLNYAEALNEATPGHSDIMLYLNKIRERAGIPEYGTGTDNNGFQRISYKDDQATVRELIRKERRVELCAEGIRYHDIRRWKLGEELLDGYDHGMNFAGTEYSDDKSDPKAFFVRTKALLRSYEKKQYWMPIHQSQIDTDPTLVQAPFWESEE
ncbi:RagB/SusD family nutrient uptake outer membrane protein [Massilibacteroides sp.]|uniref:RagB/SusD family nutrient uptake outer membrane protein n=1 Tax=Massilibacteroides sp. TaxID=2034766 RepID=UPI002623F33A|nr:RagB/SusD family nutrient uptake outer membrane protein [Massilibacteroides sp.]MDD4516308.1 RagB/SusD family nutrient uptake outer membrane protein [Massilibacteroides sp.]